MCVGVINDEMMCRINPDFQDEALEHTGCRTMDFTGRPMRGFAFVSEDEIKSKIDFMYWINHSLEFNKFAKASRKTRKKK